MSKRATSDDIASKGVLELSAAGLGAVGKLPGRAGDATRRKLSEDASSMRRSRQPTLELRREFITGFYAGEHLNRIAFPWAGSVPG